MVRPEIESWPLNQNHRDEAFSLPTEIENPPPEGDRAHLATQIRLLFRCVTIAQAGMDSEGPLPHRPDAPSQGQKRFQRREGPHGGGTSARGRGRRLD